MVVGGVCVCVCVDDVFKIVYIINISSNYYLLKLVVMVCGVFYRSGHDNFNVFFLLLLQLQ